MRFPTRALLLAIALASSPTWVAAESEAPAKVDPATATFQDTVPPRRRSTWRFPDVDSARMLEARDFDGLEKKAGEWRSARTRDEDGLWMLRRLYEGVSRPKVEDDATWQVVFDRLGAWQKAKPASVTARIATAEAWIGYAWFARGTGFARDVKPEGARLYCAHRRIVNAHSEHREHRFRAS